MYFRPAILALFAALLCLFGAGCQKSESLAPAGPPTVLSPDTAASVHWLGKKRLGITFGAYYFTRIWQQPQSAQLERQTLLKLATTPGLWLPGATNLSVDARSRLWWLLNDLVQEESYLEIRRPTNSPASSLATGEEGRGGVDRASSQPSLAFAIRLSEAQAGQWLTNLPVVLEPLTGASAVMNLEQNGWSLKTTGALIQLDRVGEWTLIGVAADNNPLQSEISGRIRRDGVPFVSSGTNLWLEASLDPSRLSAGGPEMLGTQRKEFAEGEGLQRTARVSTSESLGQGEVAQFLSLATRHPSLSHFNFSLSGDGGYVITRARATFNDPFSTPLEPWHLPVNLLHEPLTSLTAVRGLQPQLSGLPVWQDLNIGNAPDQLYLWSFAGNPYQIYLAAPMPASGVSALTDHLLQKGNPWLAAHGYISFDRAPDGNGVTWGSLPDIKPFIKSAGDDSQGWLFAGLFPDTNTAALPPPPGLIQDILRRTNLVYYDWEVTGPRLQPALQVAQSTRLIARQPQLSMDSASIQWLGSIIPRLGTSATIISRTGPAELTLYRRSSLGLTALELHMLSGWLESPQFPR